MSISTLLFIVVDQVNIDLPDFWNILMISFDQRLLHFYLATENQKLVVKGWIAQLAIHQLKNGFEAILYLRLLKKRTDDLEVDIFGELLDGILD